MIKKRQHTLPEILFHSRKQRVEPTRRRTTNPKPATWPLTANAHAALGLLTIWWATFAPYVCRLSGAGACARVRPKVDCPCRVSGRHSCSRRLRVRFVLRIWSARPVPTPLKQKEIFQPAGVFWLAGVFVLLRGLRPPCVCVCVCRCVGRLLRGQSRWACEPNWASGYIIEVRLRGSFSVLMSRDGTIATTAVS